MNKFTKVGCGLAVATAVTFAAGCAANAPAYQCGRVDYKSMASCKGMSSTTTVVTPKGHVVKKTTTTTKY